MAEAAKITRLDNLDTKGVAIVRRGANNKRIALSKRDGADVTQQTIEDLFMEVIAKGDMDMDEQAVEDMCVKAGLDPQATETFKAIMKLAYAYRDSDAMKGLLKQTFAMAAAPGQAPGGQPAAPGGAAQAGAQPGAQPGEHPGQPPHPAAAAPNAPPAPGQEGGAAPAKDPAAPTPGETPAPEKENPFKPGAGPADGKPSNDKPAAGGKQEPPMDPKEKAKLEEATKDAVAKAADAETKLAAQELVIKAQKEALDANTAAVKKMQDDLRLSQWIAKAERDLSFIPGKTADELGKMLFDIDSLNADMAKQQFELLKNQAGIVKSSGMFRPSGTSGAGSKAGNALEEIEKRAGDIVSKGVGSKVPRDVAMAQAQIEVMKADPALYKRYCDEQQDINRAAFRD